MGKLKCRSKAYSATRTGRNLTNLQQAGKRQSRICCIQQPYVTRWHLDICLAQVVSQAVCENNVRISWLSTLTNPPNHTVHLHATGSRKTEKLQSSYKLFTVLTPGGRQPSPEGCDVPQDSQGEQAGVRYLTSQEKATNYPLLLAAESCHSRLISHRLANRGMKVCLNKTLVKTAINRFITH